MFIFISSLTVVSESLSVPEPVTLADTKVETNGKLVVALI